jgi:hypothetical protein
VIRTRAAKSGVITSGHSRVKAGNKHLWQMTTDSDTVTKVEFRKHWA